MYRAFVYLSSSSWADLYQNFDMVVLVVYQRLKPVLFDLIDLYLLCYHRFRFESPFTNMSACIGINSKVTAYQTRWHPKRPGNLLLDNTQRPYTFSHGSTSNLEL